MVVVPNATPLTPDDSTTEQLSIFRLLLRPSEYKQNKQINRELDKILTRFLEEQDPLLSGPDPSVSYKLHSRQEVGY